MTGAGGFIGSHLAEKLVALGAQVRAMVHYRSDGNWGWLENSPNKAEIDVVLGDIRDRDSVAEASEGVEVIFHLAALIAIPYSYHAPESYLETNVKGSMNVFQAARRAGVERLVHTSTSEVYGSAKYVPIDEDHPLRGQSPYSASKVGADMMAEAFHLSFSLPVATIRPFNTYGPRQSARAVIPAIITQALTQPELHLGTLDPTRDFTYVADAVAGFVSVAECSDAIGKITNIGSGIEVSIQQLATLILDLVGKQDLPIVSDDARLRPDSSEVERLCADNGRALRTVGWSPQYSLEEGLTKTIDWIRSNLDRFRPGVYAL